MISQSYDCEFTFDDVSQLHTCKWCRYRSRISVRRNCDNANNDPSIRWEPEAYALFEAGFPLAYTYHTLLPKYRTEGIQLRSTEKILSILSICETCIHNQYDGQKCKHCHGCSGKGERKFLKELVSLDGHCLDKNPLF